jgi:ubiquinone/menaquinone biosynthesis C-methylase UbiE
MTDTLSTALEPGGSSTGNATRPAMLFDPLLERARTTWSAGDFGRIAVSYAAGAADFIRRLSIVPGENVLDVACGTGNLALPAAQFGAEVTGIDIARNLVDAARRASSEAGLDIRFDVGAAEALPYPDGWFDTVVSMFGVMFSTRPELALSELVRVTAPGGRIVLASWTPDSFIGSVLRAHLARVPPPAGSLSALSWGNEKSMDDRLQPYSGRVRSAEPTRRMIEMEFSQSPGGVVELFREFYGPSVKTFAALDAENRANLSAELLSLWNGRNAAADGTTSVTSEYLEFRIDLV